MTYKSRCGTRDGRPGGTATSGRPLNLAWLTYAERRTGVCGEPSLMANLFCGRKVVSHA